MFYTLACFWLYLAVVVLGIDEPAAEEEVPPVVRYFMPTGGLLALVIKGLCMLPASYWF